MSKMIVEKAEDFKRDIKEFQENNINIGDIERYLEDIKIGIQTSNDEKWVKKGMKEFSLESSLKEVQIRFDYFQKDNKLTFNSIDLLEKPSLNKWDNIFIGLDIIVMLLVACFIKHNYYDLLKYKNMENVLLTFIFPFVLVLSFVLRLVFIKASKQEYWYGNNIFILRRRFIRYIDIRDKVYFYPIPSLLFFSEIIFFNNAARGYYSWKPNEYNIIITSIILFITIYSLIGLIRSFFRFLKIKISLFLSILCIVFLSGLMDLSNWVFVAAIFALTYQLFSEDIWILTKKAAHPLGIFKSSTYNQETLKRNIFKLTLQAQIVLLPFYLSILLSNKYRPFARLLNSLSGNKPDIYSDAFYLGVDKLIFLFILLIIVLGVYKNLNTNTNLKTIISNLEGFIYKDCEYSSEIEPEFVEQLVFYKGEKVPAEAAIKNIKYLPKESHIYWLVEPSDELEEAIVIVRYPVEAKQKPYKGNVKLKVES
ncbi:hypothetical protein [Streptococcus oricebi]|uniref:Uncharacterized protein n=1 Tax=Streptococcus oricebi TaxID=1547447 RepID=A0ABS5B4S1_9STRE|nr:hypothetical protein [Streptococcus oricebi]MBP2623750.1 hypothetical protein [Streptococcus oricebi]